MQTTKRFKCYCEWVCLCMVTYVNADNLYSLKLMLLHLHIIWMVENVIRTVNFIFCRRSRKSITCRSIFILSLSHIRMCLYIKLRIQVRLSLAGLAGALLKRIVEWIYVFADSAHTHASARWHTWKYEPTFVVALTVILEKINIYFASFVLRLSFTTWVVTCIR